MKTINELKRLDNFTSMKLLGVVMYSYTILFLLLAILLTNISGKYFHDYLFVPVIGITIFGIYCIKNNLIVTEVTVTKILSWFFGITMIFSNGFLLYLKYDLVATISFFMIELQLFIFLLYRRHRLYNLIEELKRHKKNMQNAEACIFIEEYKNNLK